MIRTAESVAIGHPDKICDQIADLLLDAHLRRDPLAHTAIEVMAGHGEINIVGEVKSSAPLDTSEIKHLVVTFLGTFLHARESMGLENTDIRVNIVNQSPEIALGVDQGGAGDQGIMVGYACDETPELMPREVMIARKLTNLMGARDGKSQVTTRDGEVETIITSICAPDSETVFQIEKYIKKNFKDALWLMNPAGEWTIGGIAADTGLTGRKLAVDAYGPRIPLGGGAFSGKDASKVDRSAAYMARRIAVDYLKLHNAKEVFVELAYVIGIQAPVMATATIDGVERDIGEKEYDLTPNGIIRFLGLRAPKFFQTAQQGHFGNGFTWDI